jgi:hypothetical protein
MQPSTGLWSYAVSPGADVDERPREPLRRREGRAHHVRPHGLETQGLAAADRERGGHLFGVRQRREDAEALAGDTLEPDLAHPAEEILAGIAVALRPGQSGGQGREEVEVGPDAREVELVAELRDGVGRLDVDQRGVDRVLGTERRDAGTREE